MSIRSLPEIQAAVQNECAAIFGNNSAVVSIMRLVGGAEIIASVAISGRTFALVVTEEQQNLNTLATLTANVITPQVQAMETALES